MTTPSDCDRCDRCDQSLLTLTLVVLKIENRKIKIKLKLKLKNKVHFQQFWQYLPLKVSPLEKLLYLPSILLSLLTLLSPTSLLPLPFISFSIFSNFFLTFLDTPPQIFHHSIHITTLLYTSLVTPSFYIHQLLPSVV